MGCSHKTVKNRGLSNKFPNYKIVPFRITYIEKKCTICREIKLLSEFGTNLKVRDNLLGYCKICDSNTSKKYRGEHKEELSVLNKEYYQTNKEEIGVQHKQYREEHKEEAKRYRQTHKKEYNTGQKERRKNNISIKINDTMGNSIRYSLKKKKGGIHWENLVNYTCPELITHLEEQFTEGMSWENYGSGKYEWNIDHVIARSKFNITSYECQEFKNCWSLDNLQPLWSIRNKEKGNKPMHPKYLIKPF